jgi:LysM repeat protein
VCSSDLIKERYEIVIWGGDKARGGDYSQSRFWDPMHYALKPGTTLKDVNRVIKKLGIKPNGKRAGVNYGVLAPLKKVVSVPVANDKPEEQVLVKDKKEAPAKKVAVKKVVAPKTITHVVKAGENLTVIAQKYGSTVPSIKKENGLDSSLIRPGQKLKVTPKASK